MVQYPHGNFPYSEGLFSRGKLHLAHFLLQCMAEAGKMTGVGGQQGWAGLAAAVQMATAGLLVFLIWAVNLLLTGGCPPGVAGTPVAAVAPDPGWASVGVRRWKDLARMFPFLREGEELLLSLRRWKDLARMFPFLREGEELLLSLHTGDWDHCTAAAVITPVSALLFSHTMLHHCMRSFSSFKK